MKHARTGSGSHEKGRGESQRPHPDGYATRKRPERDDQKEARENQAKRPVRRTSVARRESSGVDGVRFTPSPWKSQPRLKLRSRKAVLPPPLFTGLPVDHGNDST